MDNIDNETNNQDFNIHNLSLLYQNKINLKNEEIESLKNQIKMNKEKINELKIENELIKEQNYNYKISNLNKIGLLTQKKDDINTKINNTKEKYISTIEEDNQNHIKNELLVKISKFYNDIYKLINKSNDNIINEYKDFDNIENLNELEKKFQFIENSIFSDDS